jgi:undecaprenyl-diphosphatase
LIHNDSDKLLLDDVMLLFRNAYTWIPLYLFILFYAFKTGKEKAWLFILVSLLTFACTDIISAAVLKPLFARMRPCHNAELKQVIRNILDCGGVYSFPSSHASNHFGIALFWYKAIYLMNGKKWNWLWIWAAAIGYAQVYVGKHYPFDILAGAIFGCLIGLTTSFGFDRLWKFTPYVTAVSAFQKNSASG